MGTPSQDLPQTAADLARLTPRELEACALHLADGWSQQTVADWLGLSRRFLQMLLASAARKCPPIAGLQARRALPTPRPRIVHLSQIGPADGNPLDADDL